MIIEDNRRSLRIIRNVCLASMNDYKPLLMAINIKQTSGSRFHFDIFIENINLWRTGGGRLIFVKQYLCEELQGTMEKKRF